MRFGGWVEPPAPASGRPDVTSAKPLNAGGGFRFRSTDPPEDSAVPTTAVGCQLAPIERVSSVLPSVSCAVNDQGFTYGLSHPLRCLDRSYRGTAPPFDRSGGRLRGLHGHYRRGAGAGLRSGDC